MSNWDDLGHDFRWGIVVLIYCLIGGALALGVLSLVLLELARNAGIL